jgi:competence protein ComGF
MRSAFNLLMAIFMLLVLSGITVLTLKYVSISSKHFADSYTQEQAEIFLQSVIEATLLEIEGTQRDGTCATLLSDDSFTSADGKFDANVTIERYYLYHGEDNDGSDLSSCSLVKSIDTRESHGYIMMHVVIGSQKAFSPIRVVYRGLQRP